MHDEIAAGGQVYIICPLVDEIDKEVSIQEGTTLGEGKHTCPQMTPQPQNSSQ